jgi:predicted enzyme related to lactoylglutathione lyase
VKNRAHLDLVPDDGHDRDTEISRALDMGATMVDDRRDADGWAVLADPEGNEFCILDG